MEYIENGCRQDPRYDSRCAALGYTSTHSYDVEQKMVCPGGAGAVFEAFRYMSAPGATYAEVDRKGPIQLWFGEGNKITQDVDIENKTITNIALPTHMFQGSVTIRVQQQGEFVAVNVEGRGAGPEDVETQIFNNGVGASYFGAAALGALLLGCPSSPPAGF
jgi:hypothetical protein